MDQIDMPYGWHLQVGVDCYNHLNIFVTNDDGTEIEDISDTNYTGHEIACRFTTQKIKDDRYEEMSR